MDRLVAAGYKVGVVKQTETAALKAAGSNKTGPFTRELTAVYTRTTLLGPDVGRGSGEEVEEEEVEDEAPYLMCVCEEKQPGKTGRQQEVSLGLMVSAHYRDFALQWLSSLSNNCSLFS